MTRPVTALRRAPKRLALAPPEVVYKWEQFGDITRELLPLFKLHWQELAVNKKAIPLDPNFGLFMQYERAGILHVLTVRSNGRLVGYLFAMVGPHLHYASSCWCHVDMFWLASEFRHGWTGIKMFRELEAKARALGAQIVCVTEKLHFKNARTRRVSRLFKFLGFKLVERNFSKLLSR